MIILFRDSNLDILSRSMSYLIQEALIKLCQANPDRTSPWEEENHLPTGNFVYAFAECSAHYLNLSQHLKSCFLSVS